jgi:hypothetical protein
MWNPFGCKSERARFIASHLRKIAVPIAEAISGYDWDGDGLVAARGDFIEIVTGLPGPIAELLFGHYLDSATGAVDRALVAVLDPRVLKGVLAIAKFAALWAKTGKAMPSYGLIDSLMQAAYEYLKDKQQTDP